MKLLRRLLALVGSMLFGYCLMEVALAIHPFVGGVVFGITIVCAILSMMSDKINNNTKQ